MTKKANFSTYDFLASYSTEILRMVADHLGLKYKLSSKWAVIKLLSIELREGRITRPIFDEFVSRHKKRQAMLARSNDKKTPLRVLFAKQLKLVKIRNTP